MENFIYHTPTKLIFGVDVIEKLPTYLEKFGKNVLLTYGGGSIKKIGLYQKVKELLKGFNIFELSGIEPNPKYNPSVIDGVKLCKQNNIDVVLSVGGGSVLDCSKAICAGACYEGDPWDLITYKVKAKKALPLVDILTLAATGSEYDSGCVISRTETNDKVGYIDDLLFPVYSFLDPRYTFSVSKRQTAAGTADAINHVMEQFFCEKSSILTDGMCLSTIKSLMENVKIALENPNDLTARSELMVDCSLACNGILSIGNSQSGWPLHGIEHALSAYYDITHGEGLAILTPRWMKYILSEKTVNRFVKFGTFLFDIDPKLDKFEIANKTIDSLYQFFLDCDIPMHLKQVGIDESRLEEMVIHVANNEGLENAYVPLNKDDILNILKASL